MVLRRLHGVQQQLYILGGLDTITAGGQVTSQIWRFSSD
jgi:hypothetical protein